KSSFRDISTFNKVYLAIPKSVERSNNLDRFLAIRHKEYRQVASSRSLPPVDSLTAVENTKKKELYFPAFFEFLKFSGLFRSQKNSNVIASDRGEQVSYFVVLTSSDDEDSDCTGHTPKVQGVIGSPRVTKLTTSEHVKSNQKHTNKSQNKQAKYGYLTFMVC
ncbi:unnamed protein product, partial [Protopolystoma xenopodis]